MTLALRTRPQLSPALPAPPPAPAARLAVAEDAADVHEGHNLLVMSDLHLGEGMVGGADALRAHLARSRRALEHLLTHYAGQPVDGRPWRLVVAGDLIDFVRARLVVGPRSSAIAWARRAVDEVVAADPDAFLHLARFVAAGHELVILKGNHDADLHWDEVQARLVEHLAAFVPGQADAVRRRVSFSRWFWHEPELVYVEHGNQYDRFCSFEHVLEPTVGRGGAELEDPIAHQTFRAFARLIVGTLDVHAVDHWRLPDFLRWLAGLGPHLVARLLVTYASSLLWMVSTRRGLARATETAAPHHRRRRGEIARRFSLPDAVVNALDDLRERPAGWRIRHGLRMLFMDQAFVVGSAAALLALLYVVSLPAGARFAGVVVTIAVAAAATLALARARDVSPAPKLRRAAARIGALVPVRFVVLGHSHVPEVVPLELGATYFNTGSWTGDTGGGLTHLCILRGSRRAELRRWCVDAGAPRAVTS